MTARTAPDLRDTVAAYGSPAAKRQAAALLAVARAAERAAPTVAGILNIPPPIVQTENLIRLCRALRRLARASGRRERKP